MGYYLGHMAVEFYKGGWILRARLEGDEPAQANGHAMHAMQQWMRRNVARYQEIANG